MQSGVVAKTPHFVLHQWRKSEPAETQTGLETALPLFKEGVLVLGALTPKRWAKRATTRNLIKRQIHHVSQDLAHQLQPTAYVVRQRAAFDASQYISASSRTLKHVVREELTQLFGKVISS